MLCWLRECLIALSVYGVYDPHDRIRTGPAKHCMLCFIAHIFLFVFPNRCALTVRNILSCTHSTRVKPQNRNGIELFLPHSPVCLCCVSRRRPVSGCSLARGVVFVPSMLRENVNASTERCDSYAITHARSLAMLSE